MKSFRILLLSFLWFSFSALATPKKMEMIFLSPQKISMLIKQLERYAEVKHSEWYAQNDLKNCVPMGDGCFHPQYGFIENKKEKISGDEKKLELKTFNSGEVDLINCDKNNYFDIFCGKEGPMPKGGGIEIWFDISSSLKTVDYNKDPNFCNRRSFMEKVIQGCKGRVNVSLYNTSLKQMGSHADSCLAYGTNDQKKLLKWMKDSSADYLLVVTDIDEMSIEMRDFLEKNGAKMTGDGVKAFDSKDLVDYAGDFIKMCH